MTRHLMLELLDLLDASLDFQYMYWSMHTGSYITMSFTFKYCLQFAPESSARRLVNLSEITVEAPARQDDDDENIVNAN